jgi:aryl-alcohol dehydrogenase-like predicted oxidoreductase
MEYRKLGRTGLSLSAVALGGHWKRLAAALGRPFEGSGYDERDYENIRCPDFLRNRDQLLSRAIELGVNYIDACAPAEILAYAKLLQGRRDRMYFGYSWHTREPRCPEWRTARRLVEGLELGLREAGRDSIDLWRISLPVDGLTDADERRRVEEAVVEGLALAKRRGLARFTGVSSHDRPWLEFFLSRFPAEVEVVLFPYTAGSAERSQGSLFEAIRKHATGAIAIKPFADAALFRGDDAEADNRRARLALRHILAEPALTAVLPGLASVEQLDNCSRGAADGCELDEAERAELAWAAAGMWDRAPAWLREWRWV